MDYFVLKCVLKIILRERAGVGMVLGKQNHLGGEDNSEFQKYSNLLFSGQREHWISKCQLQVIASMFKMTRCPLPQDADQCGQTGSKTYI